VPRYKGHERLTSSEPGWGRCEVGTSEILSVRLISVRRHGVQRTLAVLAPAARLEYVRLGATFAPTVEDALDGRVMANRVSGSSVDPPALALRPWRLERRLFARALGEFASAHRTVAIADVMACYASITPALARDALERIGAPEGPAVESLLTSLAHEGVRGLPVGPDPSAVLANAVLAHVDRVLGAEGIAHLRWVDDFVLGASDPRSARRGLAVIREALRGLGLRTNGSKTRVVADPSTLAGVAPSNTRRRTVVVG